MDSLVNIVFILCLSCPYIVVRTDIIFFYTSFCSAFIQYIFDHFLHIQPIFTFLIWNAFFIL